MFKLYSKGCQYALRALTFVVAEKEKGRFQARDICEKAEIPEHFTRKVFQSLVQGGFLEARRGPGGGYSLMRDPAQITLLEAIQAIEGRDTFDHCILGFSECGKANPCPLHGMWMGAKQSVLKQLESTTVEDLAAVTLKRKMLAERAGARRPKK